MTLPYAEDVNYWKTGRTAPDTLIDRTQKQIEELGGTVTQKGLIWQAGRSAVCMGFVLEGEAYRLVWPVLTTKDGQTDNPAARIQAATFVWHDVKAKCMSAKVLGPRMAFIGNLLTAGNRTVGELDNEELAERAQLLLPAPQQQRTLP